MIWSPLTKLNYRGIDDVDPLPVVAVPGIADPVVVDPLGPGDVLPTVPPAVVDPVVELPIGGVTPVDGIGSTGATGVPAVPMPVDPVAFEPDVPAPDGAMPGVGAAPAGL